ncbi:MAG: ABC transporter permease subunit, partial [Boseongicola sp. SB0670_bin_30]|nr:ABC transporter permease subunit [Boseongicola sp. SB0670_bin_30]
MGATRQRAEPASIGAVRTRTIVLTLFGAAILLALLKPWIPSALVRLPDGAILPWADWLDAGFSWLQNDIGLIHVTRTISGWLGFLTDAAANVLYGKARWPRLEALPWSVVAACSAVLGYWLGGWRLALLAGGTFVWTALMGQWRWAMETLSVIAVAVPFGFGIGLLLGMCAWKSRRFEEALRPVLLVLQTLPFYSYLLPAVIFFKVGPTAASVATIVYSMPPMILMTIVGLRKVPPDVVEAGRMAGCTRWQMLRHVFLPSARNEILVGLNQVIMLALAMVVLTAFIGMPGLGAKLLAMMNSFKLGRSFEIGVTIV